MNLLIYLIVAAVIGWVATELMHDRSNLLINIIVAVVVKKEKRSLAKVAVNDGPYKI